MEQETQTKVIEKIASSRKVSAEDAKAIYDQVVEDTVFQIKLVNQDYSDAEALTRAETTISNRYFPPSDKFSSSTSGRRANVIKGCLIYMLQEREESRAKITPRGAARFLFDSGLRVTKSGNPDPKSVGDALGIEGLGLVKQQDSTYPIPTKPEHFLHNPNRGISRPSSEDSTLDALCRKYGIQSKLIREQQ